MSLQSNIVTSIVRTVEPDRTQHVNHRIDGAVQDQIAAQTMVETSKKKVIASEKTDKSKIKKDRDKEGGQSQQHPPAHGQSYSPSGQTEDKGEEPEGHVIDLLA